MKPAIYGESKMTVTPKVWNHLIYFDFGPSGKRGQACWDTRKGEWKPVKGEVGEAQKTWLESKYELGG